MATDEPAEEPAEELAEKPLTFAELNIFEPQNQRKTQNKFWMKQIIKKLTAHVGNLAAEFWPPQEEAIKKGLLREQQIENYVFYKSMVIASGTATGKTEIAELAALKAILERKGKVLYTVPLRALAREKENDFRDHWGDVIKEDGYPISISKQYEDLEELTGTPDYVNIDWLVVTNERADSLIRHNNDFMKELQLVVFDEGDFITEKGRGPTLEAVITRMRLLYPTVQILILSGTIPIRSVINMAYWINLRPSITFTESVADVIGKDLKNYFVQSFWRPVPISHRVWYGDRVFIVDCAKEGGISRVEDMPVIMRNPIVTIAINTLKEKPPGQVVIFRAYRKDTVSTAKQIATAIDKLKLLTSKEKQILAKISIRRKTPIERTLDDLVKKGVAFHHAGIRSTTLSKIENLYREKKLIKVIVATTTISRGMNLPARTVIIGDVERYDPEKGRPQDIAVREYHQFVGRAGRPGKETVGYGYSIAKSVEDVKRLVNQYICAKSEEVVSQFYEPPPKLSKHHARALRYHLLSTIAIHGAATDEDLMNFIASTYLARRLELDKKVIREGREEYQYKTFWLLYDKILKRLVSKGFVILDENGVYHITEKGQFTSNLLLDPITVTYLEEAAEIITEEGIQYDEEEGKLVKYGAEEEKISLELQFLQLVSYMEDNSYTHSTDKQIFHGWTLPKEILEVRKRIPDIVYRQEMTGEGAMQSMEDVYEHYGGGTGASTWFISAPNLNTNPDEYNNYMQSIFTAMVLRDWINEVPEDLICQKFKTVQPGDIFRKHDSIERIAWIFGFLDKKLGKLKTEEVKEETGFGCGISSYCTEMFWRLRKGVKPELLSLTRIRDIGRVYARRLYNAGYHNQSELVIALKNPKDIEKITTLLRSGLTEKLRIRFSRMGEQKRVTLEDKKIASHKEDVEKMVEPVKEEGLPEEIEELAGQVLQIIVSLASETTQGKVSRTKVRDVVMAELKLADKDYEAIMEFLFNNGRLLGRDKDNISPV